jgi:DNA-binding FadR family transcriptional regulator
MLVTVPRPKIRDLVALQLKSYITTRDLKPGDRLPTETELAALFGVSRLSLREATKSLEFLGIVEARPGLGLTVGQVNMDRVTEYLGFHPALQQASPAQLIQTRIVIETGVLPYIMRQMRQDAAVYAALKQLNDQLRRAKELARWVELDIAFHRLLVESSGLSPLLAFNDLLAVFFQRFRESVKKAEWKQGIESHQRLIDALRDQKLDAACDELRRHVESHSQRL